MSRSRTIRRTRTGPIHRKELSKLLGEAAFGRPLEAKDNSADLGLVWAALRIGIRLAQKGTISASDATYLSYHLDRKAPQPRPDHNSFDQFGVPFDSFPHAV